MLQKDDFSVGELATAGDSKPETVRYFEKIGLLSPSQRLANGYRRYNQAHLRQLRFIKHCRGLGFTQPEVRNLVEIFEHPKAHTRAEVKSITLSHLQDIRQKIEELKSLESALSKMSNQCDGGHALADKCPILGSLAGTTSH